jgi:hypothetical protein
LLKLLLIKLYWNYKIFLYLRFAYGVLPILCVWGLTFKRVADELPFLFGFHYSAKRLQFLFFLNKIRRFFVFVVKKIVYSKNFSL